MLQVAACVTPPPVKQNVGNQLCDLMLSGSRLSLADGERFDKVEVDSEIVVFQPATKRKPSKESYYLTRYDPEALLNDTTDPCEIEAVTTVRRVRPKRQSLAKPPPPPTQNLDTYSWLDSEPDENVVEQVKILFYCCANFFVLPKRKMFAKKISLSS